MARRTVPTGKPSNAMLGGFCCISIWLKSYHMAMYATTAMRNQYFINDKISDLLKVLRYSASIIVLFPWEYTAG